ncbi:MAG: VOC family protein [Erysipelothrix sp.]|nr:VOC family protein [Erysipelothrix sp.]
MVGVEIDFVVKNCLEALEVYDKIFGVERIEVSDLPQGENEVVFTLHGVRFHMLDENPKFNLFAPTPEHRNTMWFNVMVEDINETYQRAMDENFVEIQPVTELTDYGVSNAVMVDPFGYVWMLHQLHKVVSHEDRIKLWEEQKKNN